MKKGKLFIFSGPSGSGKTSIAEPLLKKLKFLKKVITCTTRKARKGEKNNLHYHFFSKKQFEKLLKEKKFLEHAIVYGNYYGSLRSEVEEVLASGKSVLFVVDVKGALSIKKKFPKTITIFIKTPTLGDLEKRLRTRGKDDAKAIKKRLSIAKRELKKSKEFDYIIVNDVLKDAIKETEKIIRKKQ